MHRIHGWGLLILSWKGRYMLPNLGCDIQSTFWITQKGISSWWKTLNLWDRFLILTEMQLILLRAFSRECCFSHTCVSSSHFPRLDEREWTNLPFWMLHPALLSWQRAVIAAAVDQTPGLYRNLKEKSKQLHQGLWEGTRPPRAAVYICYFSLEFHLLVGAFLSSEALRSKTVQSQYVQVCNIAVGLSRVS